MTCTELHPSSLHLGQKSLPVCVGVFLGSIGLSVFVPIPPSWLPSFIVSLASKIGGSFPVSPSQVILVTLGPLHFHTSFRKNVSISLKTLPGFLTEITLTLETSLGVNAALAARSLWIQERGVPACQSLEGLQVTLYHADPAGGL